MTLKEMLRSLRMMTREEVVDLALDTNSKGMGTPVWVHMDDGDGDGMMYTAVLDMRDYPDGETTVAIWGIDPEYNVLDIKDYGDAWMAYTLPMKEGGDKC